MMPVSISVSVWRRYSLQLAKGSGNPVRGTAVEHQQPEGHEPGALAFPERRTARQREQVRQEIRELVHQVDAQLVVVDADVHVQAADHHAARDALHFLEQRDVALLVRALLLRRPARTDGSRRRSARGRSAPPPRSTTRRAAATRSRAPRRCCGTPAWRPRPANAGTPGNARPPCARAVREQLLPGARWRPHGSRGRPAGTPPRCRVSAAARVSPCADSLVRRRDAAGSSSIGAAIAAPSSRTQRSVPAGRFELVLPSPRCRRAAARPARHGDAIV